MLIMKNLVSQIHLDHPVSMAQTKVDAIVRWMTRVSLNQNPYLFQCASIMFFIIKLMSQIFTEHPVSMAQAKEEAMVR